MILKFLISMFAITTSVSYIGYDTVSNLRYEKICSQPTYPYANFFGIFNWKPYEIVAAADNHVPLQYLRTVINGQEIPSEPAVIIDGNVLIPWNVFEEEAPQFTAYWNTDTNQLFIYLYPFFELIFVLGSSNFIVNGEPRTAPIAAQIVNEMPFVPMQAITDIFGDSFKFDNTTQTIYLNRVQILTPWDFGYTDFFFFFSPPIFIANDRVLIPWNTWSIDDIEDSSDRWERETGQIFLYFEDWDNTVTELIFTLDSHYFTINGEIINLDVPAQLVHGIPFLPFRAIVEPFDLLVEWDEQYRIVYVR